MKCVWKCLQLTGFCAALGASTAHGTIYGTMSNFDVFNDTSVDAYGAELELEGIHKTDLYTTFPAHFNSEIVSEYADATNFGVRIKYSGYNFDSSGYLKPTPGQTTNGHACVNLAGCEHFGFAISGAQPTASRYFWLDQSGDRIGAMPMSVPTPTWSYVAPNGGGGGELELQAEVEIPKPENEVQHPDAVWMKVYETQLDRAVDLRELMSDDPVVPHTEKEVETEWELLDSTKGQNQRGKVAHGKEAVIRRYEFFKYTGAYDAEHEPITDFNTLKLDAPPAGELGDFIAANMVAANLVPLPALVQGDFNGDNTIDAADAGIMFANWGAVPPADVAIDINRDGYVDAADAGILFANWTGDSQPSAVPEASSIGLTLVGLAGMMTTRRTKRQAGK